MKNTLFSASVVVFSVLVAAMPAGFVFAQSTPSAAELLGAVNSLQTVDAARQNVSNQVTLQLRQLTEEVQNIPSQPRNTVNEREALSAELGAISAKLNELASVSSTLDQIQTGENSLFALLQSNMHSLGL